MLTVLFATRNRAAALPRVLERFAALRPPPGGWKLVVADNGSTDETGAILRGFAGRLPLEIIKAPRPGKNAALNAALGRLEGDLSVQTDDDVLPAADWLLAHRRAADAQPDRMLFGGTVEPEWPCVPPPWLARAEKHHPILYARCGRPDGPCAPSDLFGPNWAVRTSVFASGLRFDENIGPDGTRPFYAMGSETEFIGRLAARGARAWFVAGAAVAHIVRPEQLTEAWVLDRAYRNGLGVGLTGRPRCATGPCLGGMPLRLMAGRAAYRGLAALARPLPPSPLRLRLLFQDRWLAGLAISRKARTHSPASASPSERAGPFDPPTAIRGDRD